MAGALALRSGPRTLDRRVALGHTSFTIATTFRIAGDDQVIATAETVSALVDATSLTTLAPPDSLRAALQGGAAGAVTDHAAFR
jgi:hypothetical protein